MLVLIILRNAFPINIMQAIKDCQEVVNILCYSQSGRGYFGSDKQGCGILGVIDGFHPRELNWIQILHIGKKFLLDIESQR